MNDRYLLSCLIAALVTVQFMQAQSADQRASSPAQPATVTASSVCGERVTYDQLTADERKPPPQENFSPDKSPIELTISTTEFSDKPVDAKEAASPNFCALNALWVGITVSTTGMLISFAKDQGGSRGGWGKLEPDVFARLQSLMDNLPDDHHRVPPATRRFVVEVRRENSATVRLYDRADVPDEIREMLRLTGARIDVITPLFKPDRTISPEEAGGLDLKAPRRRLNAPAISPDGSTGVVHDFTTKTLTVYQGGTWPEYGLPKGGKIIRVIPESWQPDVYGGYTVDTEFSPDGRYLLVSWGKRIGALLYDTSTWQPVTDPRLFPQSLKEYVHTPDWGLGIAVTSAGETLIWDQQAHRVLSKLPGLGEFEDPRVIHDQQGRQVYTDKSAEIQYASFSPDRTRVAIYSGLGNIFKLRLSIFDIQTAKKERDLWPVKWMSYPNGKPVWWNDGRWLLAPYSSQFSGGGTGVWDAETGRFLGSLDLSDCNSDVNSVAAGTRLLQPCFINNGHDERVREWSVEGVQEQLQTFTSQISAGGSPPQ